MDRSSSLGPTRIVYIYGLSGIIHGPCSMRIRRRPLFWTRVGTPYRPIPLPIQHGAMRYVAEICLFASWMRSLDRLVRLRTHPDQSVVRHREPYRGLRRASRVGLYTRCDEVGRVCAYHRLYGGLSSGLAMIPLACVGTNTHSALCLDTSRSDVGQRGIVSALALGHAPDLVQRDLESDLLEVTAVGTFANTVGIYLTEPSWLAALEEQGSACHSPMLGTSCALPGEALCLCGWQVAEGQGVIQLAWHPRQRHILVVSLRKSQHLLVYDTSYLYGRSRPQAFRPLTAHEPALIAVLERDCTTTHQRLYFDMDKQGHWMAAGDEHGTVRIWSWSNVLASQEPTVPVTPTVQWQAHTGTNAPLLTPRCRWQRAVPPTAYPIPSHSGRRTTLARGCITRWALSARQHMQSVGPCRARGDWKRPVVDYVAKTVTCSRYVYDRIVVGAL